MYLHVRDDAMKRWISHSVIATYLGILLFGVTAHAVQYREHSHPFMYYIVWDMFCGWSSWEQRTHIIGEGDSGTLYELAPGPWGTYHPYSDLSRHNYDPFFTHSLRLAQNTLRHTDHEPLHTIYVVEESWAKKHNLPSHLAEKLAPVPTDKSPYFHIRKTFRADGTLVHDGAGWLDVQAQLCRMDNPKLKRATESRPPILLTGYTRD